MLTRRRFTRKTAKTAARQACTARLFWSMLGAGGSASTLEQWASIQHQELPARLG